MRKVQHVDLQRRRILISSGIVGGFLVAGWPFTLRADEPLVPMGESVYAHRYDLQTNTNIIEGLEIALAQNLLPGDRHLIVRAHTLRIDEPLALPGHNLTLLARVLVCGPKAAISTTGRIGTPSYSEQSAAENQDSRKVAGDGQAGGNIDVRVCTLSGSLVLYASGGRGGDAESGGDGSRGSVGSAAGEGRPGGNGGVGHQGGLAGKPGNGGNSGTIVVAIREGFSVQQIAVRQDPGQPGAPGTNGKPGKGGSGGAPASGGWWRYSNCPV